MPPSTCAGPRPAPWWPKRPPRSWARCGPGARPWPSTAPRWACKGRSPRGCSPPAPPPTRCTSSTTTSWPTPAPNRSPRAGTPNAATPSPAGTTPWWWTPAAGPCSSAGGPAGLASNLPGVLRQLRAVLGPHAPNLLGFDRGGSYPCVFTTCRDAGADWVSYRRAPLAAATANPTAATITRSGEQVQVMLADETVQIKGYGPARQLTLYEHDQPVLQVLTSDTTATAVGLLYWLRARWRIENMFSC